MSCCKNRTLEEIARTRDPKEFKKIGFKIGQTIYAQCKSCGTVHQRLVIFNRLTQYAMYDGKLTAEQLKELAPRCSESVYKFIEADYLQRRGKI